jgi:HlyD family secretion protein
MLIKNSFFLRHKKLIIFVGVIVILTVGIFGYLSFGNKKMRKVSTAKPLTTEATMGDITTSITGTGSISSASTKVVESEVSANIQEVKVEVGSKVSKGDILFVLDDTDLNSQIRTLEKNITNQNKSINEYKNDISNLNVYTTSSGYISNLTLKVGDTVNKNANLFDVTNDDVYILDTYFMYNKNNQIKVGDTASIMLTNNFMTYTGEVTYVSDFVTLSDVSTPLQEVEITLKNPGYTIEGVEATATVYGDNFSLKSYQSSKFTTKESSKLKALSSGTIKSINVRNGDYINAGDLIMTLENEDLIDGYNTAKENLSDLYEDLADVKSDSSFYTITAPIDGIVTTINVSTGDYVRSETSLAKIVNNSDVEFQIDVDELEILKVKIGQEVKVTIDAITETQSEPLIGTVSEIALEGTTMNSVTTYPVTISLKGSDDIKMGMNCSAEIIVEEQKNVLTVPVEAISSKGDKHFVTLENGEECEVEVGIYNEDSVEIVSGLDEGDVVILPQLVNQTSSTTNDKESSSFGGFGGMGGTPMDMGGAGGRGDMPNGGGMPKM